MKIPVGQRPLVHVFIVQESMNLDCLQAAIEAVTVTVRSLHPDIRVLLMSFSHRIGIYKFGGTGNDPKGCRSDQEPVRVCHHAVQYIHFTTVNHFVLDGLDYYDSKHSDRGVDSNNDNRVSPLLPIAAVTDFFDCIVRVGDYRDEICRALSSLYDSFSSTSVNSAYRVGAPETETSNDYRSSPIPQMLLGPVLESVVDWLTLPSQQQITEFANRNDVILGNAAQKHAPVEPASFIGFFGAIRDLGQLLLGTSDNSNKAASTTLDRSCGVDQAPAEFCSGLILNLLISTPQDLPINSHGSSMADADYPSKGLLAENPQGPLGINMKWMTSVANTLESNSVGVNIWPITSFAGRNSDLSVLSVLARLTGGQVYMVQSVCLPRIYDVIYLFQISRCVLGTFPKDERSHFAELVRRTVNRQLATRCIFRIRTSPNIKVCEDGVSGSFVEDPDLPGVYRCASVDKAACVGCQFQYNSGLVEIKKNVSIQVLYLILTSLL
jgi:hypothetical protein